MDKPFVWVEKYRPKSVEECILHESIKDQFIAFVKSGDFPNLLLYGTAGTGKTTVARAMCNDLGYESIIINASSERNIDLVRHKIREFSSQMSIDNKAKAIILDEADGLAPLAQSALRAAMEEFYYIKFILTANYMNKLIEPLHSRMAAVCFNISKEQQKLVAFDFLKRVIEIVESENIVEYDKKIIALVVKKYFPDCRRILNELQRYSRGHGKIDKGMMAVLDSCDTNALIDSLKKKNIKGLKQWAADNSETDQVFLYDEIYKAIYEHAEKDDIPAAIQELAMYQDWSTRSINQEITLNALLMSLTSNVRF